MAEEKSTEQKHGKQVIIVVTLTLLTFIQCELYRPGLLFLQNYLEHKKLKQLISRLNINLGLTGEDIADVLWLALKQQEYSAQTTEPPHIIVNECPETENLTQPDSNISDNQDPIETPLPPERKRSEKLHPPSSSTYQGQTVSSLKGKTLPLRHIDPPSLRKPLKFAKALRPLMRRVESGRKTILDEVETVQRTAEETICIPILKSEPEPWLDLALVIDDNSSMVLWKHLIKDLKQLLEHYGIFREVRTWGLTTDNQGKIAIRTKFSQQEQFKTPQELTDPTGRRLILIVSDCVAPMWFDGTLLSPLQDWTKHQPLALIQILPDKLWLRSGLRMGAAVKLGNLISGAANRNLSIHELLIWKDFDLQQGSKIPVLTLDPELAGRWSDFLVGKHDQIMPGFIFPTESDFWLPPQLPQSQISQLNAEQRIERFRRISSPTGRKLAGLVAAAPVITLPVVRLIQQLLLPESSPVHVAEVFLGGILKSLSDITTDTNPNVIIFDVVQDDIRDILLKDAPFNDSQYIFEVISDFIERQLEKTLRECVALLKMPLKDGTEVITPEKAYAQIALKVLQGLGGTYAQWAKEILENPEPEPKPISHPLETFEAEVATIVFEQETPKSKNYYQYYLACGQNESDAITTQSAILLIGGSEANTGGEDAATRWFLSRSQGGNYLILRHGSTGGQADWICDNYNSLISSAAELAINSRESADSLEVVKYILDADALFIPADDQNAYLDTWEGTSVQDAMNHLINEKKIPVAGTGGGVAIFGEYYYAPDHNYLLSSEILNDPFHPNTNGFNRGNFLQFSILRNTIIDVHLDLSLISETKYGRLFGFLARIVDENGLPGYAIGLEEGVFVAIDDKGMATVFGSGDEQGANAYFLQAQETPERIVPGQPLIWDRDGKAVKVYKISGTKSGNGRFDLNDWSTASGGEWQYWYTTEGESGFTVTTIESRSDLFSFTFETPTVKRRGQIIKTTTYARLCFTETLTNNLILEMVAIPGGTFTMGSPETEKDSYDDERPQREVNLSPFFMGKYPITQAQWKAIASRTDFKVNIDLEEDPSDFKDPYQKDQETIERWLRPVENVNWYEAVEFCQRLSKLTGRDYQLPSEAQWEYACRAMTEPLNLENNESYPPFYFGETITDKLANYNASNTYAEEPQGEYREETTPVGQFPANAFGLYDMHGNVWEWCADDWHDNYQGAPTDGSPWRDVEESDNLNQENQLYSSKKKKNNSNSVLRGGSFLFEPGDCRSAFRYCFDKSGLECNDGGLRVVCVFGRTE